MATDKEKARMEPEEIRELLELTGWTKEVLAGKVGLSTNIVYQWLTGRRRPSSPATKIMKPMLDRYRRKAQPA